MNSERQNLVDSFFARVHAYEDSLKYKKSGNNFIKRAFYNFSKFGLPYIFYQLSRLGLLRFIATRESIFFFGKKMILPAGDIGASVFSMYGILPHKSEKRLTLWVIKNFKENEIFYDIGAHIGYYTALSEKIAVKGETHAFEPNVKLCEYLKRNFFNSKNVYISCNAVADSCGEVDFYDATDVEDSSASSRFILSKRDITPVKVKAITIDEYVGSGNNPPTVIKLDIEGGEYDAIIGAIDTIKRNSPAIIMEVWGGEDGIKYSDKAVKKLEELGYKCFMIQKDGSAKEFSNDPVGVVSGRDDGRDNFLFLKK